MTQRTGTARSKDGTEIGWAETGEGSPLVLVHGTTAERSRWAPVVEQLSARYKVYAVDRRGRGLSGDTEPYSITREFEDIAAVVDSIDEPVNLLGHSYGAVCSLEASLLTKNIRKLVLYEPPLPVSSLQLVPDETLRRVEELVAGGEPEQAVITFFEDVVRMPPQMLDLVRSLPSWQARVGLAHTLTREQRIERDYRVDTAKFEHVSVPTLLLLGGDSPPFFSDAVRLLEKTIPDARVAILTDQQHVAMDTAPDLFVREVLGFLGPD